MRQPSHRFAAELPSGAFISTEQTSALGKQGCRHSSGTVGDSAAWQERKSLRRSGPARRGQIPTVGSEVASRTPDKLPKERDHAHA
jgi:hypothetical protein